MVNTWIYAVHHYPTSPHSYCSSEHRRGVSHDAAVGIKPFLEQRMVIVVASEMEEGPASCQWHPQWKELDGEYGCRALLKQKQAKGGRKHCYSAKNVKEEASLKRDEESSPPVHKGLHWIDQPTVLRIWNPFMETSKRMYPSLRSTVCLTLLDSLPEQHAHAIHRQTKVQYTAKTVITLTTHHIQLDAHLPIELERERVDNHRSSSYIWFNFRKEALLWVTSQMVPCWVLSPTLTVIPGGPTVCDKLLQQGRCWCRNKERRRADWDMIKVTTSSKPISA